MNKTYYKFLRNIFPVLLLLALVGCKEEIDLQSFVPQDPEMTLTSNQIQVSNQEEVFEIDIESNLPWRAETKENWINIQTNSALGSGKLVFSVLRNTTLEERQGRIRIWITDEYEKEITVVQQPGEPTDVTVHWYVKADGTGDGSSWENAASLSAALLNIENDGDVIHIAEGVYAPESIIRNGQEADSRDKTFEIARNITLIGGYSSNPVEGEEPDATAHETILSGNLGDGNTAFHVVSVTAIRSELNKVVLKGLTVSGGFASADASNVNVDGVAFPRDHGGGIIIGAADVELFDVNVIENNSGRHAGGMYVFGSASVYMERCKVNSNVGVNSNSNAAGFYLDNATATLYDSEISYNSAGGVAGGIMTLNSANIALYNSVISGNTSRTHGCGFYNRTNSKALLVNCVVSDNKNNTGNGGGIAAHNATTTDIVSSTIVGNTAVSGPAIYVNAGNTVNLYNSIVALNEPAANQIVSSGTVVNKNTIVGEAVYNADEVQVGDATFVAEEMLELQENYVVLPIGDNNPAAQYGMSALELTVLGNNLNPQVEENVITFDKRGNSRNGLTTMGAYIQGE
ncbi:MAG TPA: BACON domain-containing carbohydrate-binding protein [Mariniphaga sp.]|nr:BACON domain-containing carbohydrate-binding protein [Mariniphaga sp.]